MRCSLHIAAAAAAVEEVVGTAVVAAAAGKRKAGLAMDLDAGKGRLGRAAVAVGHMGLLIVAGKDCWGYCFGRGY